MTPLIQGCISYALYKSAYAHSAVWLYGQGRLENEAFDMIVEAGYADEDICFMREKNASGGLAGPYAFLS